jgi:hypothetical protein
LKAAEEKRLAKKKKIGQRKRGEKATTNGEENQGETVLTNDGMDELSLMVSQNSLRAVRSGRHRQLPVRYR